jgi:hypothetical protein
VFIVAMSSALVGYVTMSYQTKYSTMPTIIILLSPNNLTIIGVNKEGRNIAITWD